MNDVSVILINYNTSKHTLSCVQSVLDKTAASVTFEIIVVDNNSAAEDYMHLKTNFPSDRRVQLYRSRVNTGFGGGNMFGVQFARGRYVLFLNNDAFLKNDCLKLLLDYMDSAEHVGVVTAQNYDEHGKHVSCFDHFKGFRRLLFGRRFLERMNPKLYPKRRHVYRKPLTVNWVNGAFLFFRSSVFYKVGGFDPHLFLYCEEMDICYRLKQQGFQSVLFPEARIVHEQGASTQSSIAIRREGLLSYLYVMRKHRSWLVFQLLRAYLIGTFTIKPKKWPLLPVVLRGADMSKSLGVGQPIADD